MNFAEYQEMEGILPFYFLKGCVPIWSFVFCDLSCLFCVTLDFLFCVTKPEDYEKQTVYYHVCSMFSEQFNLILYWFLS